MDPQMVVYKDRYIAPVFEKMLTIDDEYKPVVWRKPMESYLRHPRHNYIFLTRIIKKGWHDKIYIVWEKECVIPF